MDGNTINVPCPFDYAWLDNADKKLLGAFEDLHGICFMIIEEYMRTSMVNHGSYCCNCKEVHQPAGIDIAKERKRYKVRFSSTVEAWKGRFYKLRKRYKRLRKESHKPKRNSCDENIVYVSDDSQNDQDITTDDKADGASDDMGSPEKSMPDDRKNNSSPLPKDDFPNVCATNVDKCTRTDSKIDSCISSDSLQTDHSDLMSLKHSHENPTTDHNDMQVKELKVETNDNKEGIENGDELSLSWKRANHSSIHGGHSSKVRYLDKNNNDKALSINKSIHEFFKPRTTSNIRSISSRRSKRQEMDSSMGLPRMKRSKEESKKPAIEAGSSLKLVESDIEAENFIDTKCINAADEFNLERKTCNAQKDTLCLENRVKHDPRISKDDMKLANIREKMNVGKKPIGTSTASHDSRKERKLSGTREKMDTSHDVVYWRSNEAVGLPSSASTPMVNVEDSQNCQPNTKDLEDTMWFAPESPSVVRSMFSTPEKAEEGKSGEVDKEGIQHDDGHFRVPKRDSKQLKQLFLVESQSFVAEMSADSNKSRNKNFTYKTSDGDLSADMFFENTEKSDSTQEENMETEKIDIEKEPQIGKIVPEQKRKTEPILDESYNFQSAIPDMKYKFSAVVRKRDERDKLDGYACAECAAWYEDENDNDEKRKHLRKVCRHKAVSSPPPATPEGFWSVGFPDTPGYMKKGLMLNEDDTLPLHARPKKRKDRTDKSRAREMENPDSE